MNFKNLTKFAAVAALLFASTSAFAVWVPKGPVYLYIQNDTDLDLDLSQYNKDRSTYKLQTIKAHSSMDINQLPWSKDFGHSNTIDFDLIPTPNNGIKFVVHVQNTKIPTTAPSVASLILVKPQFTFDIAREEKIVSANPDDEFHIVATIKGNQENDFAGSTIKFEVNPEIR